MSSKPTVRRPRPGALAALVALATLLPAPAASAQVDLPRKKSGDTSGEAERKGAPERKGAGPERQGAGGERGGGGVVPHLVCTVCSELNYTSPRDRPLQNDLFNAWCALCKRDTIHRPSNGGSEGGTLDLPRARGQAPAEGAARAGEAPAAGQDARAPVLPLGRPGAGDFIFQQIRGIENLGDPLLAKAVESLAALGEDGLSASRLALHDESSASLFTAARVLLRAGRAEDAERVVERLRAKLPQRAGAPLLDELVRRDPVHASPKLLVGLLEHPQQPVRNAALKHLQAQLGPELLPLLAAALDSKRVETRLRALELVAGIDDAAVLDLLLAHIADPSARVGSRVVAALATLDDPRVDLELEARAFNNRWILRENAYALLAIVEREDLTLEPILDERNVEPLLRGLELRDQLVRGACAAALAGIGFRSESVEGTEWLEREVTGRLVDVVSGREFHSDFSSLQPRALRRLRLISGEAFGSDGPAWVRWWIEHRDGFYARRVRVSLAGDRAGELELHYRSSGADVGAFTLIGPRADEAALAARAAGSELVRLTERECQEMAAVLERERALGAERLPGLRGERGNGQRSIEILVGGRGKGFTFGAGVSEPWFERIGAAARDLRDRNRWQRYPNLAEHPSARGFWEVESGWWAGERSELERGLRLKGLVLAAVGARRPTERGSVYSELERLYAIEGVPSPADFQRLLELLREEGFYTARARQLVDLALAGARAAGEGEARAAATIDGRLGGLLIDLLCARFGTDSILDMTRVALACGPDYVREAGADPRPLVRAMAAAQLARQVAEAAGVPADSRAARERDTDAALLLGMLADPQPEVEAAAVLALGQARIEAARTELLVRARLGQPRVRAAALRAIGALGGELVLDPLVQGAADADADVKLAAMEGLAVLGDPKATPLLISVLGQGRESRLYPAAWRGLMKLGAAADHDLRRVMRSPVHAARREAAMLLSYRSVPEAAGAMVAMLAAEPGDAALAEELAVLTCVDFRGASDAAGSWSEWWREVVHDDPLAWLRAAMERRGVEAPPNETLVGTGTLEGALFLLEVMQRPEGFLVERARRELSRMTGREIAVVPRGEPGREAWLAALREGVTAGWDPRAER